MSSFHYQKKKGGKGFYIALGMCLIAIGVASWTTYDSVVQFGTESSSSSRQQTEPAQNTVSGIYADRPSSSQSPSSSMAQPSSQEEPSKPEPSASTAAKPEPAPSSAAEPSAPAEPEPAQSAAAQPEDTSLVYPCGDTVTKNFSGESLIYSETMQDWRAHLGVDLGAKNGDAVSSIGAGIVSEIRKDDLLGNIIEIEHADGLVSRYCGLGDTFLVKEGDSVTAGQKIGSVSTVPYELTERPHLHLEILKDGKYVDPISVLSEQ